MEGLYMYLENGTRKIKVPIVATCVTKDIKDIAVCKLETQQTKILQTEFCSLCQKSRSNNLFTYIFNQKIL